MKGLVYLVGAGPGDPELITVKGLQRIRQADVLIFDHGISLQLVKQARPHAVKIDLGERQDRLSKEEIDHLIVNKVREGKKVVRLIAGDPLVFGSGGEELDSLISKQIPIKLIPGLSSSLAVPTSVGIPVTYQNRSSVVILSGMDRIDRTYITNKSDTLIILGTNNLSLLIDQLIQNGRDRSEPIALIEQGTTIEQKVITGTLGDIQSKIRVQQLDPSVVIVVGQAAKLHLKRDRIEEKPLFGQRILVTRAENQSQELAQRISELGGEPIEFPVLRMVPPMDWSPLDRSLENCDAYDWMIFTSINGVKYFFQRMKEKQVDIRKLVNAKIAVIGPKTKQALEEKGLIVDVMPKEYVTEALLETLRPLVSAGETILHPRARIARNLLREELEKWGCKVDAVDAYDTVVAGEDAELVVKQLRGRQIHIITFMSASAVRNFIQVIAEVDPSWKELLKNVKVVCIGPIAAKMADKIGLTVDAIADPYTIEGLIGALRSLSTGERL